MVKSRYLLSGLAWICKIRLRKALFYYNSEYCFYSICSFSICWIYKTGHWNLSLFFTFHLDLFFWSLRTLPIFVLLITNLIFYVVYSGLDHFQWKFASYYVVFSPYIICISNSVVFLDLYLFLSLCLESVTLISLELLKFVESTKKFTWSFSVRNPFSNACGSSAEYFPRLLFTFIISSWMKRGLFAFGVYLFNHKQGGWLILGSPLSLSDYY